MADYQLSPLAERDLEDIWRYTYQQWSEGQANSYFDVIIAAIKQLASGASKGRAVDIQGGYLKHAAGKHCVFYKETDTSIEVIRILHQSMDFDRHL